MASVAGQTTTARSLLLLGFDDPRLGRNAWNGLVERSETSVVFLTWEFQRAWWESFGDGDLLLLAAERDGEIVSLAPLFTDEWWISFIGEEQAEWLDVIGDTGEPVVCALVDAAMQRAPASADFHLQTLPVRSSRLRQLEAAAADAGVPTWHVVDDLIPVVDFLHAFPDAAHAAPRKKSLLRHERSLARSGRLVVEHLRGGAAILPHLDEFFAQHVARGAPPETPARSSNPRRAPSSGASPS